MNAIYYIANNKEFEDAKRLGEIIPESLAREGFVHCSFSHQVVAVAGRHFPGRQDLMLLKIDPTELGGEVVEENSSGGKELYPHIYGPLSLKSIIKILKFPCQDDGSFKLPEDSDA